MEHIAALLLIVGCSQDLGECRELPAPVPVYETYEECDAALPASYDAQKNSAERVFARCIDVDPAMEEMDAELVWDITAEGMLVASVEPIDESGVLVASHVDRDEAKNVSQR